MKFIEIEIPEYTTIILSQKKCRYCICIFVINEWDRIRAQIAKLSNYTHLVDVIIADGWSTDNSLDEDFLRKNNISALLTKKSAGKLSAQMRMGFDFAIKTWYAWDERHSKFYTITWKWIRSYTVISVYWGRGRREYSSAQKILS
jgi:hypothetical protein